MEIKDYRLTRLKHLTEKELPESFLILGKATKFKSQAFLKQLPESLRAGFQLAMKRKKEAIKASERLLVCPQTEKAPDAVICALPDQATTFEMLEFARNRLKAVVHPKLKTLAIVVLEPKLEAEILEYFGAALAARVFLLPAYGKKKEKQKAYALKSVHLFTSKKNLKAWEYGYQTGEGANIVRELGMLPPNILNTKGYGEEIRKRCRKYKLSVKFYDRQQLKKMKAGAFLAVGQANPKDHSGIYEITYNPSRAKNKKPLALVGKGLCYDTGGYDIKTGGGMATMKGDMQGSAVALATIICASALKLPLRIKAYLAITENHVSPEAYKADEIVYAMNGKSIEVVNTDAEGRMALADTLCLASKAKSDLIMDFATLTGMAVYSIGTRYGAGFTNQDKLHSKIVAAGKESGERVWTFPLDKDYGKGLESDVADTLQCSRGKGIDHILAAFFLNQFVDEKIPWVHLDLSAAENAGGLAHVDSLYTGYGVRFSLEFLKKYYRIS